MIHSKKKNTGDTIPMDEKEETYEERFQRLKSEGKLIPLGNGRWIEMDAYVETMTQARKLFKDVKFAGEFQHPEQVHEQITEEMLTPKHYPYNTPVDIIPPTIELPNESLIDSIYNDAGCVKPSFSQRVIGKINKSKTIKGV